jgi:hypothetical protein
MKHSAFNFLLVLFVIILFLASCSSNFFTGRKLNLDLVKVEKKQVPKALKTNLNDKQIEQNEILLTSNENQIVLKGQLKIEEEEAPNLEKSKLHSSNGLEKITGKYIKLPIIDTTKLKSNSENSKEIDRRGKTWDGFSIASFSISVLAILLLFTFPLLLIFEFILIFYFFEILLALTSIIFGGIGLSRTSKKKRRGRGFALLGLCLGIAQILYWIGITILVVLLISAYI